MGGLTDESAELQDWWSMQHDGCPRRSHLWQHYCHKPCLCTGIQTCSVLLCHYTDTYKSHIAWLDNKCIYNLHWWYLHVFWTWYWKCHVMLFFSHIIGHTHPLLYDFRVSFRLFSSIQTMSSEWAEPWAIGRSQRRQASEVLPLIAASSPMGLP